MTPTNDPLDSFKNAWEGLEPQQPGGDLDQEHAETQRAVAWMQEAWTALEIPTPVVPKRRQSRRWFPLPLRYAAAAAILLAVGSGLFWLPGSGDGTAPLTTETTTPDAPRILMATEERIEMESGPVRLILVAGTVARAE